MDLLSLLAACAISTHPGVEPALYQIAHLHQGNPLTIEVIDQGIVYNPDTREQAIGVATALIEAGSNVRVGLAQLPAHEAITVYGLSIEDLFTPCRNLAIGSDFLEQAFSRHSPAPNALAYYLKGSPDSPLGLGWAHDVLSQPTINDSSSRIARLYPAPDTRLFVTNEESTYRRPEPSAEHRLLVTPEGHGQAESPLLPESISLSPQKLRRNPRVRSGRSSPTDRPSSFPPVTDERLPTSSELQREN